MSKGKKVFFDETEEEVVTVPQAKAEMFEEKNNDIAKHEWKDQRLVVLVEPSLKNRLVEYADELNVKYAVIVRAAIDEYLEKRGH